MADDACDSFERSIFLVEFTTDVTAFEAAVIAFEETPDTLLKYSFNLPPKTSNFSPNSTMDLTVFQTIIRTMFAL